MLILTTSNHLYSERERNILEYIHVYDHLKKCVRREPVVSIFHFFWQTNTVHFFRQKNTVHRNILDQKSTGRSDGLISCVRYLNAAQFRKYVFLSTFFHPENNRKTYKNSVRAVLFATTIHISGKSTIRPVLFVEFGAP